MGFTDFLRMVMGWWSSTGEAILPEGLCEYTARRLARPDYTAQQRSAADYSARRLARPDYTQSPH